MGQAATLVIYAGDGTTPHGPISGRCTEFHIGDSEDVLAFILTSGRLRTYVENRHHRNVAAASEEIPGARLWTVKLRWRLHDSVLYYILQHSSQCG